MRHLCVTGFCDKQNKITYHYIFLPLEYHFLILFINQNVAGELNLCISSYINSIQPFSCSFSEQPSLSLSEKGKNYLALRILKVEASAARAR